MKTTTIAILAVLLCGCTGLVHVPSTEVEFDPSTGRLKVISPKQVTSRDFKAVINNPKGVSATVSWSDLSAVNDATVIHSTGAAEAQVITATGGLVKQIGETAGALAGTGAGSAAKAVVAP